MVRLNPYKAVHKALGIVAISSVIVIQEKKNTNEQSCMPQFNKCMPKRKQIREV